MRPRPVARAGLSKAGSVAVGLAAAGPDQGEGLAVLVVEEVGVDRSVEARIVQLDREIVAALVGALRPGGPDLGAADIRPGGWGRCRWPGWLSGTMRTPLVWTLRVTISPWNSWPDFLKVPMFAMSLLLARFRARDHRGLDGDLTGRRRSTTHPLAGRSAAEDGGGETFLPREEWAKPRGRKSIRRRCGSGDRGAAVLRPDQAINETEWCALPGTEKSEENRRPSSARDRRPRRPANRSSPRAARRPASGTARSIPRPPLLARQHRPAGLQSHRHPRSSIGHDARMRLPPLLRPKLGKNERARRIRPDQSRQEATTAPVFQGLAETAVGDAASRVHAVALITIAPITRPACKIRTPDP